MSDGSDPGREAMENYHSPPRTPKEEIWEVLGARMDEAGLVGGVVSLSDSRARPRRAWPIWAAAAAVVLWMGVGLGRMSVPAPETTAGLAADATASSLGGVRRVAAAHLRATEDLLAFVQADADAGRFDSEVGTWGRGLLLQTRLLIDSEVGSDPALRELLLDLEVILAQVALLGDPGTDDERGREELGIIARGLEQQQLKVRIQTALPVVDRGLFGT
jgi:hypothetical protein